MTVSTGTGSTFETEQTITLMLGGTATENDDFTIGSKSLLLPAGAGTGAMSVETDITAVQDKIDEPDETILVDATRGTGGSTVAVGSQLDRDHHRRRRGAGAGIHAVPGFGRGGERAPPGSRWARATGSTFETEQTITLMLGRHGHGERRLHHRLEVADCCRPARARAAIIGRPPTSRPVQDKIDEAGRDDPRLTRRAAPVGRPWRWARN